MDLKKIFGTVIRDWLLTGWLLTHILNGLWHVSPRLYYDIFKDPGPEYWPMIVIFEDRAYFYKNGHLYK